MSLTSQREIKLTNLPNNVQRFISQHLSEKNKRMLLIALRDPRSAIPIQRAWKQFKSNQRVGSMPTLPPIYRGPIHVRNTALMARRLGVNRGSVANTANAWRFFAGLPLNERRRSYGLGNVYQWRGPQPPNAVQVSYSTNGRSIPGVSPFIKKLHMKTNKQFRNYVTKRYKTYNKVAREFSQIDENLKKRFPNYNRNPNGGVSLVKLLYPKLNKSWWVKKNNA